MLRASLGRLSVSAEQALRPFCRRGFAELQAAHEPNWEALNREVYTPEGKAELAKLRVAFRDAAEQLPVVQESDWDKVVEEELDHEVVQDLKKAIGAYEEHQPRISFDGLVKSFDKYHSTICSRAEEVVAQAKKDLTHLEKELESVERMEANLDKMTVDEALAENPKIAEQIDKEISQSNYF